jgi:hypothetical protein
MKLLFAVSVLAAAVAACAHNKDAPTQAQVGAGVRDCTACVNEVAPVITSIFGSCRPLDGGRD